MVKVDDTPWKDAAGFAIVEPAQAPAADVHLWRAYQYDYEEEYTIGVYSTRELAEDAIARKKADGSMTCPRSGIEHLLLDSEEDPDPDGEE